MLCGEPCFTKSQKRHKNSSTRQCLRSAASSSLIVRHHTCLSTVSDQTFPAAAARSWNSLPQHITSTSSLPVLRARLKTRLFSLSLYLEQSASAHHLNILFTSLESTSKDLTPHCPSMTSTSTLPVLRARLKTRLFSLSFYHLDVLSTNLESKSEDPSLLIVLLSPQHPLYQS